MAMIGLLKASAAKGGDIKGAHLSKAAGAGGGAVLSGEVPVLAAEHRVESGIDPITGLRADDRTFHPFVITKLIDHSSPAFHKALATGDVFKEWTLNFKAMVPNESDPQTCLTVTLGGARIVSIRSVMPDLTIAANVNVHEYEEIAFQYDHIGWGDKGAAIVTDVEVNPAEDWAEAQARAVLTALPGMFESEFTAVKDLIIQAGHEVPAAWKESKTE
jgi:type VI secretion system Hcp family effector